MASQPRPTRLQPLNSEQSSRANTPFGDPRGDVPGTSAAVSRATSRATSPSLANRSPQQALFGSPQTLALGNPHLNFGGSGSGDNVLGGAAAAAYMETPTQALLGASPVLGHLHHQRGTPHGSPHQHNMPLPPLAAGALRLPDGEKKKTSSDEDVTRMSPKQLRLRTAIRTVEVQARDSEAWLHLARTMSHDATVKLSWGDFSKRQCLARSLELNDSADAYADLGRLLGPTDKIHLIDRTFSQRDCLLAALRIDRDLRRAWYDLGTNLDFHGVTLSDKSTLAEGASDDSGEAALVDEHTAGLSALECFRFAVEPAAKKTSATTTPTSSPTVSAHGDDQEWKSDAWLRLGTALADGASVTLSSGKEYTKRGCLEKCIEASDNATALVELGRLLSPLETVALLGSELTQRDCLLTALQIDSGSSDAWVALGLNLRFHRQQSCQVDGSESGAVTVTDCFRKAVEIDGDNAEAWSALGHELAGPDTVIVHKQPHTAAMCLMNALRADRTTADAWVRLGACPVPAGVKGHKLFGRFWTSIDCIVEGLNANPEVRDAWSLLALRMAPDTVVSIGGRDYDRKDVRARIGPSSNRSSRAGTPVATKLDAYRTAN